AQKPARARNRTDPAAVAAREAAPILRQAQALRQTQDGRVECGRALCFRPVSSFAFPVRPEPVEGRAATVALQKFRQRRRAQFVFELLHRALASGLVRAPAEEGGAVAKALAGDLVIGDFGD